MNAYIHQALVSTNNLPPMEARLALERWELFRLLADPVRLRLLGLTSVEELAVGELAELLHEGQPKISRHAAALRDAGLLAARKQGTWTLLRLAPNATDDAVIRDAVQAGVSACEADGTLARVNAILNERDAATREFFAREGRSIKSGPPEELLAYLAALAPLLPHRELAVDAGTGDGSLLEVLAPVFKHVIAFDRSPAQMDLALARVERRSFHNVKLVRGEADGPEVQALCREKGGASAVFAARVLHHAPVPSKALRALVNLARPAPENGSRARHGEEARGGAVCVLDYESHHDEALRDQQADLWLGFDPLELKKLASEAGLIDIHTRRLPAPWQGDGPDKHLTWQVLVGFRGQEPKPGRKHRILDREKEGNND